jgi:hypothetical protein
MTTALNGYCAKLTGVALDAVRSDPNVEYVKEESILSMDYEPIRSPTTAPTSRTLLDRFFRHPRNNDLGQGVDIYVVGETCTYSR